MNIISFMSSIIEKLKNIHMSRETWSEPVTGKLRRWRKIAVVNQTLGNDLVVKAFKKTGPVEIEIKQVYIKDHAPHFVLDAQTVTRIIEPGKPVKIGKHSAVGVFSARRYERPDTTSEQRHPHQLLESQTR